MCVLSIWGCCEDMKILITNLWLDGFAGTESWCYAMANELIKRGHTVDVYTPMTGKIFKEFQKLGIKLAFAGKYDLILDNHNKTNLNKFKGVVIHTCHGIIKEERPMKGAINVAVSKKSAEKWNCPIIIPNGIDTNRFNIKTMPNKNLTKILSLCKSDTANLMLKTICKDLELELKCMYGKEKFNIEDEINQADMVVGVGRSLLDAMACGRPVLSYDDRVYYPSKNLGYGYITPDKFKYYDVDSFTGISLNKSLNKLDIAKEIVKYNAADGEVNRKYILDNFSIEKTVDSYLKLYKEHS